MTTAAAGTLASELERVRLEHRAERIERVLDQLRTLAGRHAEGVPAPLSSGISDFSRELRGVRRRLREIEGGR